MGDFRIVIDAVGAHGQDRSKKDGEIVNFAEGGERSPEILTLELVEKFKSNGCSIQEAKIIHWPLDNYEGQLKNGRSVQVVDDLLTGKRIGKF